MIITGYRDETGSVSSYFIICIFCIFILSKCCSGNRDAKNITKLNSLQLIRAKPILPLNGQGEMLMSVYPTVAADDDEDDDGNDDNVEKHTSDCFRDMQLTRSD